MKTFYNPARMTLNEYGQAASTEISQSLRPFFDRWLARGFDPRELEQLVVQHAVSNGAVNRLMYNICARKAEKPSPMIPTSKYQMNMDYDPVFNPEGAPVYGYEFDNDGLIRMETQHYGQWDYVTTVARGLAGGVWERVPITEDDEGPFVLRD